MNSGSKSSLDLPWKGAVFAQFDAPASHFTPNGATSSSSSNDTVCYHSAFGLALPNQARAAGGIHRERFANAILAHEFRDWLRNSRLAGKEAVGNSSR